MASGSIDVRDTYVEFSPWAGDIPLVYFNVGNTTYTSNGTQRGRKWNLYTNFQITTRRHSEFDDKPDWAFMLENSSKDQVSVMKNRMECVVQYKNEKSNVDIYTTITEDQALELRRTLYESIEINSMTLGKIRHNVRIKPAGCSISYFANKQVISAKFPSDGEADDTIE